MENLQVRMGSHANPANCHNPKAAAQSSRQDRIVESVSSNFSNRLMSPVIAVLNFPIVLRAAQSSRRVGQSVSRGLLRCLMRLGEAYMTLTAQSSGCVSGHHCLGYENVLR